MFRVRYGPPYGNGHAPDELGSTRCPSRDGDKFHPRPDMACEYTVLPQEMTSSCGRGAGGFCRSETPGALGGPRAADEDDDGGGGGGGGRWYSCSCRRLPPVSTPRPPDSISYLSGTIDRQPGSWRPLENDTDDAGDDAHRHCTCTSGRCRQAPSLFVPRRTCDPDQPDPRRRQQPACYFVAATSDEDAEDSSHAATVPPDVQTLAPSVVSAQH